MVLQKNAWKLFRGQSTVGNRGLTAKNLFKDNNAGAKPPSFIILRNMKTLVS